MDRTSQANRAVLLDKAYNLLLTLESRLKRAVRGRDQVIELILVAILADGHVLLEDFPGSGKTTLAKALGESIYNDKPEPPITMFRRIQFTPDLLPSDITGMTIFEPDSGSFTFRPGPLFAHVVLADEINRTSPKVQSAMLEAMAEKQVTVDNTSHALGRLFFVIATQNPIGSIGTQSLPESQMDRFIVRLSMGYPSVANEIEMLKAKHNQVTVDAVKPVITSSQLVEARKVVEDIFVSDDIFDYIVRLADATRNNQYLKLGLSPRGSIALLRMTKAISLLKGRDYVTPDDVTYAFKDIVSHRIILNSKARLAGVTADSVLSGIIESVQIPKISNRVMI